MSTETKIRKIMSKKGWNVRQVNYQRPSSGFKCVEGGWIIEFDTETDNDDHYELFEKTIIVGSAILPSPGIILGYLAKDVISIVSGLPSNPEILHN